MHKKRFQIALFVLLLMGVAAIYAPLLFLYGPEGAYFDSAGVPIHYTDEGSGVPVVLVHGFAANANLNWRMPGIIDRLSRDYRVIAMDARAHGRSGRPLDRGAYGMQMVDDIARLMDHLHIEKAHLVGYSMGGFLSLAFAGKYPDRVLSLTQGGSGWYPRDKYPSLVTELPAALDGGLGFEPIVRFMERKDQWFLEPRIKVINRVLCQFNDTAAMARCFDELQLLEGTEEMLKASTMPHLTIMGTDDPLRDAADYLCASAGCCHKMHWIDGADHMTTLSARAYVSDFTNCLVAFLADHTPQSTGTGSATASLR